MNPETMTKHDTYTEYLGYVKQALTESGKDRSGRYIFRSRYKHTCRVLKWAERIADDIDGANPDILLTAAIFHDVGYATGTGNAHQTESALIFRNFAVGRGLNPEFVDRVADCIAVHSEKERLKTPQMITPEQILLMEADLLDEEGALSICWDGLACGQEGGKSYEESLERSKKTAVKKLSVNPMITPKAIAYWTEKQELIRRYLDGLAFDLEEWK